MAESSSEKTKKTNIVPYGFCECNHVVGVVKETNKGAFCSPWGHIIL